MRERPLLVTDRAITTFDIAVGVGVLVVLFIYFRPSLLLLQTTTTGGDTGAHVYAPWHLKEHLLPDGWISGWSNDWYAGFPFLHFYFPLVIGFQALLSFVIPFEIAFKLGTIAGTFFLPVAFYMFFRLLRFRWPGPAAAAVAALVFLFMDSFNIYGGNIASSLAGEYSFSLSMGLCLVFFGLAYRIAKEEERPPVVVAGVVIGLAALSHLIPVIMVVLTMPLLLWWSVRARGIARTIRRFGVATGIGLCLSAFWSLPFVARLGYATNMKWGGIEGLGELFPGELLVFLILALVGAGIGLGRMDGRLALILWPGVFGALLYLWLPDGHIWNGRFIPFWYVSIVGSAAYGFAALVPMAARLWRGKGVPIVALSTAGLLLGATCAYIVYERRTTFVDFWIEYNYEGYEEKEDYPVFRDLNEAIAELPPGRVMWEPGNDLGRFGTPIALMALPYFAGHATMEGIYFESSITTPFHFIMASELSKSPSNPIRDLPYNEFDIQRGIDHMELFDVRYYVAFSDVAVEAADSTTRLEEIDVVEDYHIYEVASPGRVVIPENEPVVYEGDNWFEDATEWFARGNVDVPLMKDGPESWQRSPDPRSLPVQSQASSDAEIDVEVDGETIRFTTDAIGEPHWVKTSYFPNWKVEGARGPFEGAPSLMMVVPTDNEVTLSYERTWIEWLGLLLTTTSLVVLLVPPLRRRLKGMAL